MQNKESGRKNKSNHFLAVHFLFIGISAYKKAIIRIVFATVGDCIYGK